MQLLVPIANTLNGGKREFDVASEIPEWQVGNPNALLGLWLWDWAGGNLWLMGHPPAHHQDGDG